MSCGVKEFYLGPNYRSQLEKNDVLIESWIQSTDAGEGDIVIAAKWVEFSKDPKFVCKTLYLLGVDKVQQSGYSAVTKDGKPAKVVVYQHIGAYFTLDTQYKGLPEKIQQQVDRLVALKGHYADSARRDVGSDSDRSPSSPGSGSSCGCSRARTSPADDYKRPQYRYGCGGRLEPIDDGKSDAPKKDSPKAQLPAQKEDWRAFFGV